MMKGSLLVVLLALLSVSNVLPQSSTLYRPRYLNSGLRDLSDQISKNLSENRKRRIAVVEFVDLKGEVTNLGRYISEKLITNLFKMRKFRVIERQRLNRIIREQNLDSKGIVDPESVKKLGRVLGLDAIAFGSISDLTKTLELNARLIGTENGEVFSVASVEIHKDDVVCNLMGGCREKDDQSNGSFVRKKSNLERSSTKASKKGLEQTWVAETNFFTFKLLGCEKSGDVVRCRFNITNNGDDRSVKIYTRGAGSRTTTMLYDNLGNEYGAYDLSFGNAKFSMGGLFGGRGKRGTLVSGVTTSGRIQFNKIDTKATKIALLVITATDGRNDFRFQFRNLPLTGISKGERL